MTPSTLVFSVFLIAVALPASPLQETTTAAAVEAAINQLSSLDFPTRMEAARTIRRAPADTAVPPLVRAARSHADGYVRYRALTLLSGFGGPAAAEVMREVKADKNDRLRTVAFAWFEHHQDPDVLPALLEALEQERSEFVRPALTRAIAAHGSDPRAQKALVPLVIRGQDFFRGAVIEALGDYRAAYALAELAEVAKIEGPLQDDAITAIGKIGDRSMAQLVLGLQRSAPRDLQPTLSASLCVLGTNCPANEEFLKKTLSFALTGGEGYQAMLRGVAHAMSVMALHGKPEALGRLFDAGVATPDPVRAPLALAIGVVALRNPELILSALESRADRDKAIELLRDAFDMLSEDYEEERFYVAIRRAYWAAPEGSPRRQLTQALIRTLEF